MTLYTVKFTTRKVVSTYNQKREVIATREEDIPVTITGLPHVTAQAYAKCDNFQLIREIADYRNEKVSARRSKRTYIDDDVVRAASVAKSKPKGPSAAATGDLSAAINA